MRNLLTTLLVIILFTGVIHAQLCDGVGNVLVFANYDGGELTIDVDQNIPNLKIGICTYEATIINITGAFAGNVTEVRYAGFDSYNNHCSTIIDATVINAPGGAATSITFAPTVTLTDPNGYSSIICGYGCDSGNQGGCNTAAQIADYFVDLFNGNLRLYYTQYGCWPDGAIAISDGGYCCEPVSPEGPVADFMASNNDICTGDCIDFLDLSSNDPTEWLWEFEGTNDPTTTLQDPSSICFENAGSFTVTLTASNAFGSTSTSQTINVTQCDIPGCTYPQATNYNPLATVDDQSCTFLVGNCDCPADFTLDGVVGVADLLIFISEYGTLCD